MSSVEFGVFGFADIKKSTAVLLEPHEYPSGPSTNSELGRSPEKLCRNHGVAKSFQSWASKEGIAIILPTAIVENGRVYNSGRYFGANESKAFYKVGLTASEQKFFSIPDIQYPKIIEVSGFRFAILICFEAQHEPWTYFNQGDLDAAASSKFCFQ